MIAKIIAQAPTRNEALARLAAALRDLVVVGPRVNAPFLKMLAEHPEFRAGRFDTGFIERHLAELLHIDPHQEALAIGEAVALLIDRERRRIAEGEAARKSPSHAAWHDPWSADDGFALGPARTIARDILVDGAARQAMVTWGAGGAQVTVGGVTAPSPGAPPALPAAAVRSRVVEVADGAVVVAGGRQFHVALRRLDALSAHDFGGDGVVRAPMNGKIIATFAEPGQRVKKGARIALMEAMKMEHSLTAPIDGIVREVAVAAGAQATEGTVLARIEADEGKA
jgi:3-methylcrotonyl-CoA carboxylase alpha subunit